MNMTNGQDEGRTVELSGERRMYPTVSGMFRDLGYSTIQDAFTIEPYRDFEKRIDILAFKWKNGDSETIAVECKDDPPPRGVVDGLSQAITYLLYFDDVYIATIPGKDLSALKVMAELGIGYIQADEKTSSIVSRAAPGKLPLLDYEKSLRHVRSPLKALSIFKGFVGSDDHLRGGLRNQDELWCAMNLFGEFQQNLWLNEKRDKFHSGINLEHKPTERRIFGKMERRDSSQLARLIEDLPRTYGIKLARVKRVPRRNPLVFEHETVVSSKETTRRLLRNVRAILKRPYWTPEISINRPVWSIPEDITLGRGIRILEDVREELAPLIDFFQDLYSR